MRGLSLIQPVDPAQLDKETQRIYQICDGCRRCFNLCDSFPRLFDLIDNGPTGELDGVKKEDYAQVEEACTLCDMCFMVKCPYVPPHEFDLDFPHLMLRYRGGLEVPSWVASDGTLRFLALTLPAYLPDMRGVPGWQ